MKILNDLDDETLLNTVQACQYVPYTKATLNLYRRRGKGPKSIRIGGRCFYKVKDLRDYLKGEELPPTGA
jgi:hypothetical protein